MNHAAADPDDLSHRFPSTAGTGSPRPAARHHISGELADPRLLNAHGRKRCDTKQSGLGGRARKPAGDNDSQPRIVANQ
ncbi:hypothetical protein BST45_02370 [Mycobacterium shinjukuense]|nr:hypothetical protein BST45_02370 [Mycobacterium shinjukuense]